jgi:hypothetical protein
MAMDSHMHINSLVLNNRQKYINEIIANMLKIRLYTSCIIEILFPHFFSRDIRVLFYFTLY